MALEWQMIRAGSYKSENSAAVFEIERHRSGWWVGTARPKAGGGYAQWTRRTLAKAKEGAETQSRERRYH